MRKKKMGRNGWAKGVESPPFANTSVFKKTKNKKNLKRGKGKKKSKQKLTSAFHS